MVALEIHELLGFFKALADLTRLRIIGMLASEASTVEQLAAALGLSDGTVSHHLRRLSEAGLVAARPEGYYRYYSLRREVIDELAARLLKGDSLPPLADGVDRDAFDRKVLAAFTDAEGRVTAFPAQQKKLLVILAHVARAFEAGRRYPERQVNEILAHYNEDTARLRRALVDFRFMRREGGGGAYELAESETAAS
ncbi:MAG: metalloregulator ArsR/SmtB family transcription factor [Myxococcales bacterium]|nr:metalloregulator ArsR/SmtB family transcription factor [Myxococcales bacterium]